MPLPIGRRGLLKSAGATSSFLACYGVLDRVKAAVPVTITPPVVDKLTIQVVIDSAHDIFIPADQMPGVQVERVRAPAAFNGRTLECQWGLSLHLVSTKGKDTRRYLLDFGFTPDVLTNNLQLLGIDPATLDALILSHGHLDHMGGLTGFLQTSRASMREDLMLYVGGEDTFCHRLQQQPDGSFAPYGVLERHDLKALRVQPILSELPIIIEDHAFTTGIIPRTSIEHVLPNTYVVFGERDGVGCDAINTAKTIISAPRNSPARRCPTSTGTSTRPAFNSATAVVVITSCGHAGIINTLRRAQEITGIERIHALCGGSTSRRPRRIIWTKSSPS